MTDPRVSAGESTAIIIPCYRVAGQIAGVIRSIPPRFGTIICVDDASPDDTAAVIERLADPRVTLLRHAVNAGVGGAMKTGYAEALRRGAAVCVKMDGDGQMSAAHVDDLVAPIRRGADYAKGNRFVDLRALARMPRIRLVGNALLSFASKLACGYWNMLDVSNGFTAVRGEMLRRMDLDRVSDRYFFETSVLIELNILRATVADVEMPAAYGDEESSLRIGQVAVTFPALLVRGLLRRIYWRYLIEDFGVASICLLLGVPVILFGATFGGVRWAESIRSGTPATPGTVFVAALPIILGFQLLLAAVLLDVLSSPTLKCRRSAAPAGPA
jgi:glycosyltransferase involved in cell wall biosynthesis